MPTATARAHQRRRVLASRSGGRWRRAPGLPIQRSVEEGLHGCAHPVALGIRAGAASRCLKPSARRRCRPNTPNEPTSIVLAATNDPQHCSSSPSPHPHPPDLLLSPNRVSSISLSTVADRQSSAPATTAAVDPQNCPSFPSTNADPWRPGGRASQPVSSAATRRHPKTHHLVATGGSSSSRRVKLKNNKKLLRYQPAGKQISEEEGDFYNYQVYKLTSWTQTC
ncbi:hypothetical protein E2562_020558 [Oryza meyeriana var. granulata]|uniref:Uncharacterized protein n=1 Tax=Oryza meyeriana var. granulata TaxID=110450 RepID=A0A6G1DYK4_9ORYZ|nr:hypothetical protein E2562_020558 [Oryza meyeriana var. granulata]